MSTLNGIIGVFGYCSAVILACYISIFCKPRRPSAVVQYREAGDGLLTPPQVALFIFGRKKLVLIACKIIHIRLQEVEAIPKTHQAPRVVVWRSNGGVGGGLSESLHWCELHVLVLSPHMDGLQSKLLVKILRCRYEHIELVVVGKTAIRTDGY